MRAGYDRTDCPLLALALVLAVLVAACAGPEDPTAASGGGAPAPAGDPTPSATEGARATTADGQLDFGPIAGSWSGTVDLVIFGENPAGSERIDVELEPAAERISQVGTMTWFTPSGEPGCAMDLIAVEAQPPRYVVRERAPEGQAEECAEGRITLTNDPASGGLEFAGRWRDVTAEGVLSPDQGS